MQLQLILITCTKHTIIYSYLQTSQRIMVGLLPFNFCSAAALVVRWAHYNKQCMSRRRNYGPPTHRRSIYRNRRCIGTSAFVLSRRRCADVADALSSGTTSTTLSLRPCHGSTTLVHATAATGAIPLRSYRVQHHALTATNKITSRWYYDQ